MSEQILQQIAEHVRGKYSSQTIEQAVAYIEDKLQRYSDLRRIDFFHQSLSALSPEQREALPLFVRDVLSGQPTPVEERRANSERLKLQRETARREQLAQGRKKAELKRLQEQAQEQRRRARYEQEFSALQSDRRQLQQLIHRLDRHKVKLDSGIHERLSEDFLGFDRHIAKRWPSLARAAGFYQRQKERFVADWAAKRYELPLDDEQAAAVGSINGNVLVTARAGSGKTRVLTARALFLHKHCGIPVHRIMLLAFNRRAAAEMESRLREWLGDNIPHVMTFHALAYALVHPSQKLLFDDRNEGKQHLSEVTQRVIDELVTDSDWSNRIRALMLEHFRVDWNRIDTGGYNLSGEEFLKFRYSLQHETLKGERVSNFGQKAIANLLASTPLTTVLAFASPGGVDDCSQTLPLGTTRCRPSTSISLTQNRTKSSPTDRHSKMPSQAASSRAPYLNMTCYC
ncbi:MAG: UvrD-helicase domain-containing protein [Acidimicrobiaceae bacterium]|nr:UvrD-helicase domain-containing protein [Acidimicrobiaceae bacterium]